MILHFCQDLDLSLNLVVLPLDHDESNAEHNRDQNENSADDKHYHKCLVFDHPLGHSLMDDLDLGVKLESCRAIFLLF